MAIFNPARKAALQITYAGKDITKDISDQILSFEYNDNLGKTTDDISIVISDKGGLWANKWSPAKGDVIKARIVCTNWEGNSYVDCGSFTVDEIEHEGPPDIVTIKAVADLTVSALRKNKKSRSWENTSLEAIASQIAKENSLGIYFKSSQVVMLERVDQSNESDLAFLDRICDQEGINLKLDKGMIVIMDRTLIDAQTASVVLEKGVSNITKWKFKTKSHDIYTAAIVTYWDDKKKENISYKFGNVLDKNAKVYIHNTYVKDRAQAKKVAEAAITKSKRKEFEASIDLSGSTFLCAGITLGIKGFGIFDGKYTIKTAKHTLKDSYKTSIELQKAASSA